MAINRNPLPLGMGRLNVRSIFRPAFYLSPTWRREHKHKQDEDAVRRRRCVDVFKRIEHTTEELEKLVEDNNFSVRIVRGMESLK